MQLRDFKTEIMAPGHWGFFGGGVEPGESTLQAAYRELSEELNLHEVILQKLSREKEVVDLPGIFSSAFTFYTAKKRQLTLLEGVDLKFASPYEILSGSIYSEKFGKSFPVVKTKYVGEMVSCAISFWKTQQSLLI